MKRFILSIVLWGALSGLSLGSVSAEEFSGSYQDRWPAQDRQAEYQRQQEQFREQQATQELRAAEQRQWDAHQDWERQQDRQRDQRLRENPYSQWDFRPSYGRGPQ
jgi:hypothetical protein